MSGKKINEINLGDTAKFAKTISEYDVYGFAGIVGDFNQAHVNEEFAKETMFKKRIAHGILGAGLISTVLGTILPGEGTIYLSQSTKFLRPVYLGDTITAIVEVISKDEVKNRVTFQTKCINQNGEDVIVGESLVMPPR